MVYLFFPSGFILKVGFFRGKIVLFPGELRRFCFYKKSGTDQGCGGLAVATESKTRAWVARLRRYRPDRCCGGRAGVQPVI